MSSFGLAVAVAIIALNLFEALFAIATLLFLLAAKRKVGPTSAMSRWLLLVPVSGLVVVMLGSSVLVGLPWEGLTAERSAMIVLGLALSRLVDLSFLVSVLCLGKDVQDQLGCLRRSAVTVLIEVLLGLAFALYVALVAVIAYEDFKHVLFAGRLPSSRVLDIAFSRVSLVVFALAFCQLCRSWIVVRRQHEAYGKKSIQLAPMILLACLGTYVISNCLWHEHGAFVTSETNGLIVQITLRVIVFVFRTATISLMAHSARAVGWVEYDHSWPILCSLSVLRSPWMAEQIDIFEQDSEPLYMLRWRFWQGRERTTRLGWERQTPRAVELTRIDGPLGIIREPEVVTFVGVRDGRLQRAFKFVKAFFSRT